MLAIRNTPAIGFCYNLVSFQEHVMQVNSKFAGRRSGADSQVVVSHKAGVHAHFNPLKVHGCQYL
jgi:hypothetical protein